MNDHAEGDDDQVEKNKNNSNMFSNRKDKLSKTTRVAR